MRWRTSVAYHEAGHAIVAQAIGHGVTLATIKPDWKEGYLGRVQLHPRSRLRGVALLEQLALVHVAGLVAQRLYAPWVKRSRLLDGAGTDLSRTQATAYLLCPLEGGHTPSPAAMSAFERASIRKARRMLLDRWWAVHRVAEALLAHDAISGFAIERIAAEATEEWSYLAPYLTHGPIEHMRQERRARRVMRPPQRRDLAGATLRASLAGAPDIATAALADLAAQGFDLDACRALWARAATAHNTRTAA